MMSDVTSGGFDFRRYKRDYRKTCSRNARTGAFLALAVISVFALGVPLIGRTLMNTPEVLTMLASAADMVAAWGGAKLAWAWSWFCFPFIYAWDWLMAWSEWIRLTATYYSPFADYVVQSSGTTPQRATTVTYVLAAVPQLAVLMVLAVALRSSLLLLLPPILFACAVMMCGYLDFVVAWVSSVQVLTGYRYVADGDVCAAIALFSVGVVFAGKVLWTVSRNCEQMELARLHRMRAVEWDYAFEFRVLVLIGGVLAMQGGGYAGALLTHKVAFVLVGATATAGLYAWAVATLVGCGLLVSRMEPLPKSYKTW